jgi:uncharacterized sulfatase
MSANRDLSARLRLLAPLALLPRAGAAAPRPNILFIAADDLNVDLGCYGHPLVRTPNLDGLASRGVRFDQAFCQYPVCNPSRTSILSGRYPETTGILDNRVNPRTNLPGVEFLPEFLRARGYFTARVGKIYHDGMDGPNDWDVSLDPRPASKIGRTGEGRNLTGGKFAFFEWRAAEGSDEDQPDGLIAGEAIRLISERRDKPFFIGLGLRKPHDPYIAPKKYFEPYPLDKIAAPESPADDEADIPPAAYPPVRHNLGLIEGREFRRAYYACISFMDAQLGKVLRALESSPAASNTLIIFFGDHGLHLGEHGWWNKVTLFDRSARAPLIIVPPGGRPPGAVCRRPVEFLGFYPTIAELAGFEAPAGLQGASLAPLLRDPEAKWSRPAYTVVLRGKWLGRAVHDGRFRYIEWNDGADGVELYDHAMDPREYRNLARAPEYASIAAGMKRVLAEVRYATSSRM